MNNGYYLQPASLYFKLTVVRIGYPGEVFYITHNPFLTLQINTLTSIATSMLITATQTANNIFMRNYMNTAIIELNRLYLSKFIKAFYIIAPANVTTWDMNYCNATLTVSSTLKTPYPYRLRCGVITSNTLQILVPNDFPIFSTTYQ
jgi:hypothetical protein